VVNKFKQYQSFLGPSLGCHVVNVSVIVFIPVSVNLAVFAKESSLVESVFVWKRACLRDLILLGVENVGRWAWGPVFLSSENKNLLLRDWACAEPVLNIGFEGGTPHFYQLPESWLLGVNCVQPFDVCDRWLVSTKDINIPLLDCDCGGQVSVSVELRFFSPAIVFDRINLTSLWSVVETRSDSVNEWVADSRQTVPFSRVDHVGQLNQSSVSKLVSMIWGLRSVLSSACDKDPTIICLDWAKSYWDIEIDVQDLPLFSFVVNIIERHNLLIEFEKMNFVCSNHLELLLVLVGLGAVNHADASLIEVIGHCELRVSVEWNVLSLSATCGCWCVSIWERCSAVNFYLRFRNSCSSSNIVHLRLRDLISALSNLVLLLTIDHLLKEQFVNFNIAVVHHQILSHEILESSSINNFKLTVPFEPIYHRINPLFKLIPVLFVSLYLSLRSGKILIELLEVIVVINLFKLILLGDLPQLCCDFFAEFASFFWELFLHLK